jgi:hypothetical protein
VCGSLIRHGERRLLILAIAIIVLIPHVQPMTDHPLEAADLLLSSMYRRRHSDRLRSAFMFSKPGQHPFSPGGGGTEVYFDRAKLLTCALYIQKHGATHLRGLPVGRVESDLGAS